MAPMRRRKELTEEQKAAIDRRCAAVFPWLALIAAAWFVTYEWDIIAAAWSRPTAWIVAAIVILLALRRRG